MLSLETMLLGNSLQAWATAIGLALIINLVIGVGRWWVLKYFAVFAAKTPTGFDDAFVAMARQTKQWLVFGVTLFVGTKYLELDTRVDSYFVKIATVAFFLQIGLWLSAGMNFWISRYRHNSMNTDAAATTSLAAFSFVGKMVLWSLVLMLMLSNLGIDVTALVAGLGVGGIAIALAAQNILGDLFASLSIVIDKPFVVGDFIEVDTFIGTVEHVGLKTTRIRSNTGEQIVISNGDLLKTRIRNYKRMEERRILFRFGVIYQTPAALMKNIPRIVQKIIDDLEAIRFERTHFVQFGDSSLDFEVVYWMLDPDFIAFRDAQQAINYQLFERFTEEGIEFAYPTQTLFAEKLGRDAASEEAAATT